MENASKALIIAGAILLSILIIGLGMLIFTQAQEAMQGAGLSSEQVTAYNSKFVNYEGTQSGSSVRSLCEVVRNHNNVNTDDTTQQVGITYGGKGVAKAQESDLDTEVTSESVTEVKSQIKNGKMYTVSFKYAKSGMVMSVEIVDKTQSGT